MTRTNLFTFDVPKIIFCIGLLYGCLLDKNLTAKTIHNYDTLTKPEISHRQKQLFKSIHIPEIDFEVYGEFPTIKHFDLSEDEITPKYQKTPRFLQSREKRDLQNSEGNFFSDKYSILIKSRIHSPLKNWDDRLTDPQSKIYKLLSTSYCEFLLQSFQHANTSRLKQPECTFLEFTKGSIVLNAILTFNEANYSLLSPQDLSNLLIKGSKELIDSIVNDKTFSLGFNFNGDFSLRLTEIKEESDVLLPTSQPVSSSSLPLSMTTTTTTMIYADEMYSYMRSSMNEVQSLVNSRSDFMYTEKSLGSTLPYSEQVDETLDSTTYSVALNFTIKGSNSSLTWDDDLLNTTSTTYQELYRNVCELLLAVMRSILSSQWIVECGTIQFKKGSIDVDAELILTVNSSSINATSEPTSTILNDTNIITEINEYVSTVDQNDTFEIYIDPNSSISLSLIVISMESTISYDTQVIQDVTSSETNDEDSDPITMETNLLELTNESTVGENNSTDTSTLVIEQKKSTEMPYTPTLGATDSLITSIVSRISEETPDTTLLAQTFTDDMFLDFPLSVYSTSTG
ncbi:unnamed protein product [Schistosoma rodhaini]|nr:unnamed protein product [Schistosoma rodhaini]